LFGPIFRDFPVVSALSPVAFAFSECIYYAETQGPGAILSEVEIIRDDEANCDVVELLGPQARLVIPCKCDLPYFVIQMKDLGKFTSVELAVVDDNRRIRRLHCTNKVSVTKIDADVCTMPLLLDEKCWNYICLDLVDLAATAFGVTFKYCKEVVITSNTAVARVFFQDKRYEDAELPAFLRVIP
jgi:Protein of unknown function (DUF667)